MEIEAAELMQHLGDAGWQIVDVREVPELASGMVPGAASIPMSEIERRTGEIDKNRDVVCYCEHGIRSLNVAGWLAQQGYRVRSLRGGFAEWPGPRQPAC